MQITNVFQNKNDEFYKEGYMVAHLFVFYQRIVVIAKNKVDQKFYA